MKNSSALISNTEIVIMNRLEVKPTMEKAFLEEVEKFAVATRKEGGNISFDLFKVEGKANQYAVFERYESKADFDTHLATQYASDCFAALPDLLSHPMQEHLISVAKIEFTSTK